ncbi:MAG: undecaprenyl-diphosphate phosphatase [Planctomycetaceae bacterium]
MSYLQTIILGIVQGIAEFLPISSSGHLVLVEALMHEMGALDGNLEGNLLLNIALHFGTLLSIVVIYYRDLLELLSKPRLILAIVVATAPLGLVLVLKDYYEALNIPWMAGIGLSITASLLFITPKIDSGTRGLDEISLRDALIVGLFQVIAPLPGISRSGTTIVAGLLTGMNRETAAKFSFLIAIPAILGATVAEMKDVLEQDAIQIDWGPILVGTVVAFVVGVVSLKALLRVIASRQLRLFGWYCLVVSWLVLAWQTTVHILAA